MKKKLITVVLLASILVSSLSISVAAQAAEELEPVNATMISNEYKETNKTIKSSKIGYQPVSLTVVDNASACEENIATNIIVDKEFYDSSDNKNKREINQVLKDELDNKKKIVFYGDSNNLNLGQLAKTMDHEMSYTITPEGESVEEAKKTYAYTFEKTSEGNMLITQYVDTNDEAASMEENLENIVNHRKTLANTEGKKNNATISTQLRTYNADHVDTYAVVKTDSNVHITINYELKRVKINSNYTVWDVKITNITEPYYGYQCYETKLQIYRPDKGLKSTYDETLLDFSPESTNGSSSKTIGVSVSGGNANPTASFSQSISDCTIAVSNQGYNNFKEWQYRYITNTTIAKGSTKQTALTRWANKKGAFSVSLNSYARVIFSNPVGFPVYSSTTWFLRLDKNDIK